MPQDTVWGRIRLQHTVGGQAGSLNSICLLFSYLGLSWAQSDSFVGKIAFQSLGGRSSAVVLCQEGLEDGFPGGFPGNHHTSVRLAGKRPGILIRLHCLPPTTILVARQPPRAARIPWGKSPGEFEGGVLFYPGNRCFFGVFPSSWRPETRETYVTARPTGFSVYQVGSSGHFCASLGTQVAPVALADA